jgi:hypothetical protein
MFASSLLYRAVIVEPLEIDGAQPFLLQHARLFLPANKN